MDLLAPDIADDQPLLLYDGSCGVCQWCVSFVLRHQPGGDIRFASLDSPVGRRITATLPTGVDSIVWVSAVPRHLATESSAVLALFEHLGGVWRALGLFRLIPRPLRDALYRFVARHRHRLGDRAASCLVPTDEERGRFLAETD